MRIMADGPNNQVLCRDVDTLMKCAAGECQYIVDYYGYIPMAVRNTST